MKGNKYGSNGYGYTSKVYVATDSSNVNCIWDCGDNV